MFRAPIRRIVDLLIGIDNYFSFVTGSIKKGGPTEQCAVEFLVGYSVLNQIA